MTSSDRYDLSAVAAAIEHLIESGFEFEDNRVSHMSATTQVEAHLLHGEGDNIPQVATQ